MKPIHIVCGCLLAALAGCGASGGSEGESHVEDQAAGEAERGPHGGRLLRSGDFAFELRIFEQGVPPEYHAYGYVNDKPLPPAQYTARVTLKRLGGEVDRFEFRPSGDFLRGQGVVREPHSFDVKVEAGHAGRQHVWEYPSYEGRTQIAPEIAAAAGIEVEPAGPARLRTTIELTGTVQARPDRQAYVHARFPGVVREVRADVGDQIAKGAILATVQSNVSLEAYTIHSPMAGVVLTRTAHIGALTSDDPAFTVADLSTVFAELDAHGADVARLHGGQKAEIEAADGSARAWGELQGVAPTALRASQSVRARVVLKNDGSWRPGQFVRARIVVDEAAVPLAVRNAAIQQFRDFQVVFARVGDIYEVRMLELGRRDREWSEVLDGLQPGVQYVTQNSFLVKADVEKSGASHDH